MQKRNPSNVSELADLFRRVLELPASTPPESLTRASYPEWDSLRHVKLMLKLQEHFGVRFSASDILRLNSFAEICEELVRRNS